MRQAINDAMKNAMKAQDKLKLSTLRLVNAAIKNADIEARSGEKGPLADEDLRVVLQRMIKQRQDSITLFEKGGRVDLAEQERGEIEIIQAFLPQQMTEAQAKAAIAEVIEKTGAQGLKDMGKVMAALKQSYAGTIDLGKASGMVRALLAG